MGTSASAVTAVNLLTSWLETHPYFQYLKVELYTSFISDTRGWILVHNRNVCIVATESVEVLSEHCAPDMQHAAKWTKIDICDPEFFMKLERLLRFWI